MKEAVSCFESMGFEVVVERNLHYVDMMRLLSRVAQMDHSDSDCLVVALLSHGNDGSVYAYDAAFPTQVHMIDINHRKSFTITNLQFLKINLDNLPKKMNKTCCNIFERNCNSGPISAVVGAIRGG